MIVRCMPMAVLAQVEMTVTAMTVIVHPGVVDTRYRTRSHKAQPTLVDLRSILQEMQSENLVKNILQLIIKCNSTISRYVYTNTLFLRECKFRSCVKRKKGSTKPK